MSHIPSSAMPHPHVHDDQPVTPEPQQSAGSQEPAAEPANAPATQPEATQPVRAPEQAEPASQQGSGQRVASAGGSTVFKAGAWLALGAGLAAAVTAAVIHRPRAEPDETKPKRRRKRKAD